MSILTNNFTLYFPRLIFVFEDLHFRLKILIFVFQGCDLERVCPYFNTDSLYLIFYSNVAVYIFQDCSLISKILCPYLKTINRLS